MLWDYPGQLARVRDWGIPSVKIFGRVYVHTSYAYGEQGLRPGQGLVQNKTHEWGTEFRYSRGKCRQKQVCIGIVRRIALEVQ